MKNLQKIPISESLLKLDNLTLYLNFDLAILSSAVKDGDNLDVYVLENFIQKIYDDSKEIRNIFNNEL